MRTRHGETTESLIDDGTVGRPGSPFALPTGWRGRLAGWLMARSDQQHRELARLLPAPTGARLLEIGFGPGQLLASLGARESTLQLAGVDPSELMVKAARRRNPAADLRLGAAGALPVPDRWADVVVSVNNLPLWPDLEAGLTEVARVLAPGGIVFLAWHGGREPSRIQRSLCLDANRLAAVDRAVARHLPSVERRTLSHSELWVTGG